MKESMQKKMFEAHRSDAVEALKMIDENKLLKSLDEFASRFHELRPESFTAKSLRMYFHKYVESKQAETLSAAVLELGTIYNADTADVKKFEETLNEYAVSFDEFDKKEEILGKLSTISMSNEISIVIKSSRLYYGINDIPDEVDLITEIRPIYSDSAGDIEGFIVRNVLHIEKLKLFSYEKSEFSLSEAQVEELGEMCDRARIKINTVREKLGKNVKRGIATFGGGNE